MSDVDRMGQDSHFGGGEEHLGHRTTEIPDNDISVTHLISFTVYDFLKV